LRFIAIGHPMVNHMYLLTMINHKEVKEILFSRETTKMKKTIMELNKETAMRLWSKSFGNATKVLDFAGRMIAKGAYNDRNSDFGWNVDHILPQSKGGKTADYNLICCNIATNDEKADKFPCFNANNKKFEIVKCENHYEIQEVNGTQKKKSEQGVNFMDAASGVRFFKKLKGIQNQGRWVGTVKIVLSNLQNTAVVEFICHLFKGLNISLPNSYGKEVKEIIITNYDMPNYDDSDDMMDKCTILNTYLKFYFLELGYFRSYQIFYSEEWYEKEQLYNNGKYQSFHYINYEQNKMYVNEVVLENNGIENKNNTYIDALIRGPFTLYDIAYKKLERNLEKEVSNN